MRNVTVKRETKETNITITMNPDGTGKVSVDSGLPFFDHMLTAMAKHGGFDLTCIAKGDLGVDCHHTIEDIVKELRENAEEVPEEAEDHIKEFIKDLVDQGLVGYELRKANNKGLG